MSEPTQPTTDITDRDLDGLDLSTAEISALLDGELASERLLEVIDQLVDDPESRNFYRRSRALSGLLAAHEPVPTVDAPDETWRRIAADLGAPIHESRRAGSRQVLTFGPWLAAAALLLIVAVSVLTSIDWTPTPPATPSEEGEQLADITIGSRPDAMTEERFITLATELLEADRRYRREMVEIINAVDSGISGESRSEEPLRYGEGPESSLLEGELDSIEDGRVDRDLSVRRF